MEINNISNTGVGNTSSSASPAHRGIPEEYRRPSPPAAGSSDKKEAAGQIANQSAVSDRIEEITEDNLKKVEEAVEFLEHAGAAVNYDLEFNILPSENVIQARILEGESGELIREIPPSEVIETRKRLRTFIGLMVDIHR